ncbi:MAG: sensor domain-containing diguanylate cyclase [bacterium]|nr:MAG: sensor domain-containing diguanylate cyclase [bacterium]
MKSLRGDRFYRELLDNLYDGVYFVDRDRKIVYWNRGAERLTGYAADEAVGRSCWDNFLAHMDDRGEKLCQTGCPLTDTLEDGKTRETDVYLYHKQGHRVPVLVRVSPIWNKKGDIIGAVEVFSDNSAKIQSATKIEELQELALLDELTKLGNRRYMEMGLKTKLEEMERYRSHVGVLFMDLDHFKDINDKYGHDVGDRVLQTTAATLKGAVRPHDLLCRWGGEEFVAAVTTVDRRILTVIAQRFRSLIEQSSVMVADKTVRFTISIGATLAHSDESMADVVRRSDELMYQSKEAGRNRVTIG